MSNDSQNTSLILATAVAVWLTTAGAPKAVAEDAKPVAPIEFVRDVVPVLTKAGCNAGACHGSFQGRGGLRLSLFGFDPQADHVARVLKANKPQAEVIDEFYLVTCSRRPTPAETARCRDHLAKVPSQKEGYEDLLWALINCAEFIFNH